MLSIPNVEEMIVELSVQTEYTPVKCFWDEYITLGETVAPKISVTWGQRGIYGQYCSNGISGCAATAIGQIFTYHGAPSSFVVTTDMGDDYSVGDTINLDWTKIRLHETNHTSSASCDSEHNNIGALLREIGAQVKMEYNTSSSSAHYSDVPAAISYFGYVGTINRSPSIAEIKSAIKNSGPVYMRGTMDTLGHAWVVDGYKDYEYYKYHYECLNASDDSIDITKTLISESHALHINWGWDGDCNGYFAFGVYNTSDADSYDSTSYTLDRNYNINNAIIAITRE